MRTSYLAHLAADLGPGLNVLKWIFLLVAAQNGDVHNLPFRILPRMRRGGGGGERENFVPPLKLGIRGISDRVVNASAPGNFGPRVSIFHLIIIVYYR